MHFQIVLPFCFYCIITINPHLWISVYCHGPCSLCCVVKGSQGGTEVVITDISAVLSVPWLWYVLGTCPAVVCWFGVGFSYNPDLMQLLQAWKSRMHTENSPLQGTHRGPRAVLPCLSYHYIGFLRNYRRNGLLVIFKNGWFFERVQFSTFHTEDFPFVT